MNPFCNKCGNSCGGCGQCQPKCGCEKKCCQKPCGCPESILSIESETTNPTDLRFNLGGRSVSYDFDSVIKAGETCTSIIADKVNRTLNYHAECHDNTITASELGAILHMADIGDVDATTLGNNSILVHKNEANCGENCDGKSGWVGLDPSKEGDTKLDYIIGSDRDGAVKSLMPPANSNQFYYLSWAAGNKAQWKQPRVAASAPVDSEGKKHRLYLDPNTHEIVVVKE